MGLFLIGCVVIWYAIMDTAPISLSIAGISIYPMDFISGLLMVTGTLGFVSNKRRIHTPHISFFLCIIVMLIMLLIGINRYGLEKAINSARVYIYFYSIAFYVLSLDLNKYSFVSFLRVWAWISIILVSIFSVRLVLVLLGIMSSISWQSVGGENLRVLSAGNSLFMFQGLILAWFSRVYSWKMPFKKFLSVVLLPIIFFLQHRTVWVVAIVSLALLFLTEKKIKSMFFSKVFQTFVLLSIVALVLVGGSLVSSLRESSSNSNTWLWRLESWRSLLGMFVSSSIFSQVFGHPFGIGYFRDLFDITTTVQPHNFYVQNLWDFGITGLLLFLCSYGLLLNNLRKTIPDKHINKLLFVLIIGQLLFFITYAPYFEQGIVIGIAFNVIGHAKSWQNVEKPKSLDFPQPVILNTPSPRPY